MFNTFVGLILILIGYTGINAAFVCVSNTDCIVDCSVNDCSTQIDASQASSLMVLCPNGTSTIDGKCQTTILCPYNVAGNLLDCNVYCDKYGCYGTTIEYNEFTSLELVCRDEFACTDIELTPSSTLGVTASNTANITCVVSENQMSPMVNNIYPCENATFNVNQFNEVNINCINPTTNVFGYEQACTRATFDAFNSSMVNISCNGHISCESASFHCPSNNENVCNFECTGDTACANNDIFTRADFVPHFVSFTCNDHIDACWNGDKINCGIASTTLMGTNTNPSCNNGYCCPFTRSENICVANSTCIIDCTPANGHQGCAKQLIDGRNAKSLTVSCGSLACDLSLIHCPDNGNCNVECAGIPGGTSCNGAYIYANESDTVNITCGSPLFPLTETCKFMSIFADDVSGKLSFEGNGAHSGSSISYYARNANDVELTFTGSQSGLNATVRLDNTMNAKINCDGSDTCQFMRVYYNNANDINAICDGLGCPNIDAMFSSLSPTPVTLMPSGVPTKSPSNTVTDMPTLMPSDQPSISPTLFPSESPTKTPTETPVIMPTSAPTSISDTRSPTQLPTQAPALSPTSSPSTAPTASSLGVPTSSPVSMTIDTTTAIPTMSPSASPENWNTQMPSNAPSNTPGGGNIKIETPKSKPSPTQIGIIIGLSVLFCILLICGGFYAHQKLYKKQFAFQDAEVMDKQIHARTNTISNQTDYNTNIAVTKYNETPTTYNETPTTSDPNVVISDTNLVESNGLIQQ